MTRQWILIAILAFALVLSLEYGCLVKERVILIPSGEPVQLAECVNVYVYLMVGGEKVKSPSRVMVPAGWWCLPDTGEEVPRKP